MALFPSGIYERKTLPDTSADVLVFFYPVDFLTCCPLEQAKAKNFTGTGNRTRR